MIKQSTKPFLRTLNDLEKLADSEFIRRSKFDDFSIADLKKLKSDDFRHLCKKKLNIRFIKHIVITTEKTTRVKQDAA